MIAKGNGRLRAVKYINHIIVLARMGDKPITQLSKAEVERLISQINTSNYKETTKRDYKIIMKRYFQWSRGLDEDEQLYPDEVRWIKTTQKRKRLLPEALLSVDEIKKMVETAENQRDRAFILTHYESGCRIGETLSLRICNISFDKNGAILRVDGKTGPRRVRVIAASPAIASWLNIHPLREDPNAYLWVGTGTVGRYEFLNYDGARALLKRLALKAGLNKRVYTHLLRHSRATALASDLKEAQLKEMFGWVPGSDMPETYVHLSGRDVDSALLRLHGIELGNDERREAQLTTVTCPRCKLKAGPESQFCPSCGMVLDLKAAVRLEDERSEADRIMNLLMRDDDVRMLLAKKVSEFVSSQPLPSS
jgi:integrase